MYGKTKSQNTIVFYKVSSTSYDTASQYIIYEMVGMYLPFHTLLEHSTFNRCHLGTLPIAYYQPMGYNLTQRNNERSKVKEIK